MVSYNYCGSRYWLSASQRYDSIHQISSMRLLHLTSFVFSVKIFSDRNLKYSGIESKENFLKTILQSSFKGIWKFLEEILSSSELFISCFSKLILHCLFRGVISDIRGRRSECDVTFLGELSVLLERCAITDPFMKVSFRSYFFNRILQMALLL